MGQRGKLGLRSRLGGGKTLPRQRWFHYVTLPDRSEWVPLLAAPPPRRSGFLSIGCRNQHFKVFANGQPFCNSALPRLPADRYTGDRWCRGRVLCPVLSPTGAAAQTEMSGTHTTPPYGRPRRPNKPLPFAERLCSCVVLGLLVCVS